MPTGVKCQTVPRNAQQKVRYIPKSVSFLVYLQNVTENSLQIMRLSLSHFPLKNQLEPGEVDQRDDFFYNCFSKTVILNKNQFKQSL